MFSFLSVARSANNPFRRSTRLHFSLALLKRLPEKHGSTFPSRIKIHAKDWRALCDDRFPIDEGHDLPWSSMILLRAMCDSPYPNGLTRKRDGWKYQLGQLFAWSWTGHSRLYRIVQTPPRHRSHVLYIPVSSSWMRRRYGIFNGRNAFGPSWLPIFVVARFLAESAIGMAWVREVRF